MEGDAAYAGMEVQVLDSDDARYKDWLKPWQRHGSIYGVVAAKPGGMKAVGEWNTEEIQVKGRRVKVTLNGTVIVDADLDEATRNGTLDGKPHPGLARTSGHIGFLPVFRRQPRNCWARNPAPSSRLTLRTAIFWPWPAVPDSIPTCCRKN